jgi:hypothetical protein
MLLIYAGAAGILLAATLVELSLTLESFQRWTCVFYRLPCTYSLLEWASFSPRLTWSLPAAAENLKTFFRECSLWHETVPTRLLQLIN